VLVSSLIDAGGPLSNYTSPTGAAPGIAITATNLAGGKLWFSIDNGGTWAEVGAVSDLSARVLHADGQTRLYYQPAAGSDQSVVDVVTFTAWDRSGGFANGAAGVGVARPADVVTATLPNANEAGYYAVALSPDGRTAFLADGFSGLKVVDVRNPTQPVVIGEAGPAVFSYGIAINATATVAYVADYTAGVRLFDISTPTTPQLLRTIDTPNEARDVLVAPGGRYLFVADGFSGLQVIDLEAAGGPAIVHATDTPGYAISLSLSPAGNTLFVADGTSLRAFDVSNPADTGAQFHAADSCVGRRSCTRPRWPHALRLLSSCGRPDRDWRGRPYHRYHGSCSADAHQIDRLERGARGSRGIAGWLAVVCRRQRHLRGDRPLHAERFLGSRRHGRRS
jgi:hypothetical protein